jgi:hypothetical protein
MEKVKYVTYKVLIAKERTTSVFDDMITIPENKPYSEIPAFISAYVRTRLENIMLTEEERAEIHNDRKTYEQGLTDAWEVLRKLQKMPCTEFYKLFPCCEGMGNAITELIRRMTPSEAIAKIKAYEDEQQKIEREIKVGDEVVENGDISKRGVVTYIKLTGGGNLYNVLWDDGRSCGYYKKGIKKTDRHFPQVEELLKAMKDDV